VRFYNLYYRYDIVASQSLPTKYDMVVKSSYDENAYKFKLPGDSKSFNLNLYCEMENFDSTVTVSFAKITINNKSELNKEKNNDNYMQSLNSTMSLGSIENRSHLLNQMKSDLTSPNITVKVFKYKNGKNYNIFNI